MPLLNYERVSNFWNPYMREAFRNCGCDIYIDTPDMYSELVVHGDRYAVCKDGVVVASYDATSYSPFLGSNRLETVVKLLEYNGFIIGRKSAHIYNMKGGGSDDE